MKKLIFITLLVQNITLKSQCYWQQKAEYKIKIDFHPSKNKFEGVEEIKYTNNSPDTLHSTFIHLYYNAFQPGSSMDIRSRTISDPDQRVLDKIQKLSPKEIGYHNIHYITLDNDTQSFFVEGTVLEINLSKPIIPNQTVVFKLNFDSQVPKQIRRTGRNNKEGIDYTMTQWYPKLAEYDKNGWQSSPYIGREFYGIWGNFDVKITIPKNYIIAGTGIVQNGQEIGYGYENKELPLITNNSKTLTWHFKADNVHDFAWAADPDFKHDVYINNDGLKIRFFYQPDTLAEQWKEIQDEIGKLFQIMNMKFGQYPYSEFSVIQGGDGGMEYPMCTMILGHKTRRKLIELIAHESFHNWYYGVLATDELKYPWMDEGFTSFAEHVVIDSLFNKNSKNPLLNYFKLYKNFCAENSHQPMSIHADHFITNQYYWISSYIKGAIFLQQLLYIMGENNFYKGMKNYFNKWKFKHPDPNDFKRIMEKTSNLELDWYFEEWIYTTNTIDYAIESVENKNKNSIVKLKKIGNLPMPIEILVIYKNGHKELYYIPLDIMRGEKKQQNSTIFQHILKDWKWGNPNYSFIIPTKLKNIKSIEIDPYLNTTDMNIFNNFYPKKG